MVSHDPVELPDSPDGLVKDASTDSKEARDTEALEQWKERRASLPPLRKVQRFAEGTTHVPKHSPPSLLEGLSLRTNDLVGIVAPRGTGKTWLVMDLAEGLAAGPIENYRTMFLFGHFPVKQRVRVAIVHAEMDDDDALDERWGKIVFPRKTAEVGDYLTEYFPPDDGSEHIRLEVAREWISGPTADSKIEHLTPIIDPRLEGIITSGLHDVLILDPWAAFLACNENDNTAVAAIINSLWFLARANNVMLVFTHHPPKGASSSYKNPTDMWRGAGVLADRCSVRITATPYYRSEDSAALKQVHQTERQEFLRNHLKVNFLIRNGVTPSDITVKTGDNRQWEAWTPPASEAGEQRRKPVDPALVIRLLRNNGGRFSSERAASAAIHAELVRLEGSDAPAKRTIDNALHDMVADPTIPIDIEATANANEYYLIGGESA